jgi:hypothetical protein
MRTTIRLPTALLERAKARAHAEGITLTALIERGLETVLDPSRSEPSVRPLPVCTVGGGLRPGVWQDATSAMLSALDLADPEFRASVGAPVARG